MNASRPPRPRDDDTFVLPPGSPLQQCAECTILIGEGYQEVVPFEAPGGEGVVCSQCYESLRRRARRQAQEDPPPSAGG